jgi:leucine dehydrogenase
MQPYASIDDALDDVLRLSQGMTFKNAMAGLPLGGGKCVIVADPGSENKTALLRAFAAHVQMLGGRFWTAIDVGVGPPDAETLAENCDYIFANASRYPPGFDPSSYTALGGLRSIQAAATHVWGSADLTGRRVAVQGLGAAGGALARHLAAAGAELVLADIRHDHAASVASELGATVVDTDQVLASDVDILAPCALGAILTPDSIRHLQAQIVCGLANNQLSQPDVGLALAEAGITYVPDYVA